MACSSFLCPVAFSFSQKPLQSTFLHSSTTPSLLTLNILPKKLRKPHQRRSLMVAKSNGRGSADIHDRLTSALCYLYPFSDGIGYGKHVITQFYPVRATVQPLLPTIRVYTWIPFHGFLGFWILYFLVARNRNFSRYVRFNATQAILLDGLLVFPQLLEKGFHPRDGLGLDLMMSVDNTVFLFLLVCLIYGSSSCLLGQTPRLPIVAEAADREVL
ncbi:TIC 20-v [Spatholobus suberectus]|nr:TIC 20-v [Spatholobus suberectus]